MLKKKTVNILYDNTIYRPIVDDDTNKLINDLQTEVLILNSKLLESYEELDTNKEIIKELKKNQEFKKPEVKKEDPKPKNKYSTPMYPVCYMYIPVYQINQSLSSYLMYPIYPIYPNIYYHLCH